MGSTFYATSQCRVNRQMALWKDYLPAVKPYYAVKCNPDKWLMSWLAQQGAGFDCASTREIDIVRHVDPNAPILYANPCKKREDILYGAVTDIATTVIDSREEIDKLAELGWSGSSLLRIRVEDSGSLMPFGEKFGATLADVRSMSKYATVKGQNLSGISFHVGSGCKDVLQYKTAIFQAYSSLLNIRKEGHHANVIDIGGGFTDNFVDAARVIQKEAPEGVMMIAEPGRFFAEKSQDLFVRVIGKKPGTVPGSWRYTLDESLYGQFSCIPYDQAKPKWIRVRAKGEERRPNAPCILYGRTCDSVDYIASADAEMLEEGDWLWFPHMGAYTSVTSTEFNGFPKPPNQVLEMHGNQLPDPSEFQEWPTNLKYVSHVEVPKN